MVQASKIPVGKEQSQNISLEFFKRAKDAVDLAEKKNARYVGLRDLKVSRVVFISHGQANSQTAILRSQGK
jgi:hypothetical protein